MRHLIQSLVIALVSDEAHRDEVVSHSSRLFIFFNHAKDSNDLLPICEVNDICLVILMLERKFVLLSKRNNFSCVFLDLNEADYIVIPEEDGIDFFALVQVYVGTFTLLGAHHMLVKLTMMVSQNRVLARVERVKFFVLFWVLRCIVSHRDTHAVNVMLVSAYLDVNCAHVEHIISQSIYEVIHV